MRSGRCRYRARAALARAHQKALLTFFHLTRTRPPAHVTGREVLNGVTCADVLTAFNPWAEPDVTLDPEAWLAMAGNALASHRDGRRDRVSALCVAGQGVFAQTRARTQPRHLRPSAEARDSGGEGGH